MEQPVRILIADDHQLFIDGIKSLLKDYKDIEVVASANNGLEVIEFLKENEIDLILMDIAMAKMNGMETTKTVIKKYPEIKIIGLSMFGETFYVKKMFESGAQGYVLKNIERDELLLAIKMVAEGSIYISKDLGLDPEKIMESIKTENRKTNAVPDEKNSLSPREIEIIKLIVAGLTIKEIAAKLFLSYFTVDTHKKKIFKKLNVNSISALIRYSIENQILSI
ncbi:MAG: response regulator transcription factor [Bacteroidota bacterium]